MAGGFDHINDNDRSNYERTSDMMRVWKRRFFEARVGTTSTVTRTTTAIRIFTP